MKVTFDSNVWEKILRPERAIGDEPALRDSFPVLRQALVEKRLSGFVAEAYFTIEAMTKSQRADFLARQAVVPQVVNAVNPDGTETAMVFAAADESRRPQFSAKVIEPLSDAIALGLKILPHPRFHTLSLPAAWFVEETEETASSTINVTAAIEGRGLGREKLHAYSRELAGRYMASEPFFDVPDVPMTSSESKKVAALAAEWADGEAIACHIGFENDVFCTQDLARNASKPSIFDADNRLWLAETFGARIATVQEVCADLT